MARTKAEVLAFLEGKVNTRVNDKLNSSLNGQCVTLIKALLEFLGVSNPYAARGNAKDYGDSLIRQGLGVPGRGWLTVAVSRTMGVVGGVTYGHIWADLLNEANYEQNGAKALTVTKNTRPLSQAQQLINLDQWIKEDERGGSTMAEKVTLGVARIFAEGILGRDREFTHSGQGDADLNANHVGRDLTPQYVQGLWESTEGRAAAADRAAKKDFWNRYNSIIGDLQARPTQEQLKQVVTQLEVESQKVKDAEKKLAEEQAKKSEDTILLDEAGGWFTKLINRLLKRS